MSNGTRELVLDGQGATTPANPFEGCPGQGADDSPVGGDQASSRFRIRRYSYSRDWKTILGWWRDSGEVPPLPQMMPEESSFVAEVDGQLALAVTVYLTNTHEVAYVENFIWSQSLRGRTRRAGARTLCEHISRYARERGYLRLVCMSEKASLQHWYQDLGFTPTVRGVTTFVRST